MTRRMISLSLGAVVLILAAVACQVGGATFQLGGATQVPTLPAVQVPAEPPVSGSPVPVLIGNEHALEDLYKAVSPGVVALKVTTEQGGGLGSGFVFDTEGHIVTNYHVVDGATQVEVDFPSGFKVFGEVVGRDPDSDLAVVK